LKHIVAKLDAGAIDASDEEENVTDDSSEDESQSDEEKEKERESSVVSSSASTPSLAPVSPSLNKPTSTSTSPLKEENGTKGVKRKADEEIGGLTKRSKESQPIGFILFLSLFLLTLTLTLTLFSNNYQLNLFL
jgi:hypothetical protein